MAFLGEMIFFKQEKTKGSLGGVSSGGDPTVESLERTLRQKV